jgi:hypothetical protein
VEVDEDGDGDVGRAEMRLACCCCFFLSFCDILLDVKFPEDLRSVGVEESPRDRLDVRDDDACCMISRMSSLFDVNVEACQGSPDLEGESKGSGSTVGPVTGEGLP